MTPLIEPARMELVYCLFLGSLLDQICVWTRRRRSGGREKGNQRTFKNPTRVETTDGKQTSQSVAGTEVYGILLAKTNAGCVEGVPTTAGGPKADILF